MLIPRRTLFGNPRRIAPKISPDGKRLAYIAPHEGVLNVWVRGVGKQDDAVLTRDRGRGITQYMWARNSEQILYVQDKDGDENWHVFALGLGEKDALDLTPVKGVAAFPLQTDRDHPDEIVIAMNDRDERLHDLYLVETRSGERRRIAQNDFGAIGWIVDNDLRPRIAVSTTAGDGRAMLRRVEDRWEPVVEWESDDALTTMPFCFAGDNRTLYMMSSIGTDSSELRQIDIETLEQTTLASHATASVSGLELHPRTKQARAVAFEADRVEWQVLDPAIEEDFRIVAGLHRGDFDIVGKDDADRIWLVCFTPDQGSVCYYVYDRESRRGDYLFAARPELDDLPLAAMEPIRYQARDGREIHGYLTLPEGREPRNLPAILLVHGGPWWRDSWGYSAEVQWLANRGYAVLQVNFRGSTGFGKAHINAGDREWGGRMQDDLSDAVAWLVERGIAAADRVGIYGGSYGGYAVLGGLTFTPDLYACGVDIVGPSNLISFIETVPPYWEPLKVQLHRRVGHPERDREFLEQRSPLFHVERIDAPLMIVQGANDPRVKREESVQIRDALVEAGKVVDYMEFEDEGHGFQRPENKLRFYAAAERFLAAHLGGECEGEEKVAGA